MNGTGRAALRRPRITQSLLFELRAFANITGDGKADPLLRNVTTGEWIYYATGNRVGSGHPIAMRLHRGLGMPPTAVGNSRRSATTMATGALLRCRAIRSPGGSGRYLTGRGAAGRAGLRGRSSAVDVAHNL